MYLFKYKKNYFFLVAFLFVAFLVAFFVAFLAFFLAMFPPGKVHYSSKLLRLRRLLTVKSSQCDYCRQ